MSTTTTTTTIRPANPSDLPQILAIYNHYVLQTVTSFLIHPASLPYIESRYTATRTRALPYLVATQDSDSSVVGYASASPFRGFMLGYGHTVELTIFLHPSHLRAGIGSLLLSSLLEELKATKHVGQEVGYEERSEEFKVWNILAVMSVDEESVDGTKGMGLRDWYARFGFVEVGRLRGVGWKKGRRLDTLYMELQLK